FLNLELHFQQRNKIVEFSGLAQSRLATGSDPESVEKGPFGNIWRQSATRLALFRLARVGDVGTKCVYVKTL
ncbi:hypothetical protein A2U01_0037069, partial [Trifolium medium]|nr:hypothetical protein [Trifolium medium]